MKTVPVLFVVLVATMSATMACKCINYSAQNSACSQDLVVKALLLNSTIQTKDGNRQNVYTFSSLQIFKGSIGDQFEVSDLAGTSCSLNLSEGQVWLITGQVSDSSNNNVQVGACNFHREWQYITEDQKQGFEGRYYQHC